MALIWYANDDDQSWTPWSLEADSYHLGTNGLTVIDNTCTDSNSHDFVFVRRDTDDEEWLLIVAPESRVRINSIPLLIGARVLRDHDEILVSDMTRGFVRFFFSTERLVQVQPFPAVKGSICCPRCKQMIHSGDMAVQCPNPRCRVWHHQKEDQKKKLLCWSYEPTCGAQCGWPTNLNADYCWKPEYL